MHKTGKTALSLLDKLPFASPLTWLGLLALATPWVRFQAGNMVVYPGHWVLSLALVWWLLKGGLSESREPRLPLSSVIFLGMFLVGVELSRKHWAGALQLTALFFMGYTWLFAAFRLGRNRKGVGAGQEGLILFFGFSLLVGVLQVLLARYAPGGCLVFNCLPGQETPPLFRGGWGTPSEFLLAFGLILPLLCASLVVTFRDIRQKALRNIFMLLLAITLPLVLATGTFLALLFLVAGGVLVARSLMQLTGSQNIRLVLFSLVSLGMVSLLFFGVFPSYVSLLGSHQATGGEVKIEQPSHVEGVFSSRRTTDLLLKITNSGHTTLSPSSNTAFVPMLRLKPEGGKAWAWDGEAVPLEHPLLPGKTWEITLPVRLPHWFKEGFFGWRIQTKGAPIPLAAKSSVGFRVVNKNYWELSWDEENLLTPLAQRADDFSFQTYLPKDSDRENLKSERLIGELLDVLLFSPFWGLPEGRGKVSPPFSSPRPFWMELTTSYGLVALFLVLIILSRTHHKALKLASGAMQINARLMWGLIPVSLWLTALVGLFTPAPASYHGFWGLMILVGLVEGRFSQVFPRALHTARTARSWRSSKQKKTDLWRKPKRKRRSFFKRKKNLW